MRVDASGPGASDPADLLGEQESRLGVAPGPRRPASRRSQGPVVLVGCSAAKLSRPAPARDLYTSSLFRMGRAYAEARGDEWAILSALHGLVLPDEVLDPYDCSPVRLTVSASDAREWGARVARRLDEAFPGARVVLLAGGAYRPAIEHLPRSRREEPLAGLGIGHRRAWLSRQIERLRGVSRG